uniref:Biogenesis of lysosomal organelles complex-1 subunit 2 n=1 Tax=Antheraea pernyi TaxID=7119 RepID=A0A7L9VVQ6_ANTPE|nr:biogenesis of lysosome-related organelles complex-1 subunit 2 [Antheraea pernyi]QPF69707.1 biogenesis of lysosomal organelles complex-1 subunit 2 [Antheraea pernyi]
MSMSEEEIEKWTMESRNKELPMSISCSSFEVLDPHDPVISRLATQLFKKTNDYLQGEMAAGQEHYTLIEDLNRLTITKYADLKNLASNLNKSLVEYNELYIQKIKPLLEQIDMIHTQVTKLEASAYRLDSYTKQLKARFIELEDK